MNDVEDLLHAAVRSSAPAFPLAPWGEIERRARTTRRPRWVRRGLALGVLVAALAGALLFGVSTNGSGPSALQRASAAVADWPGDRILHMRIRMVSHFAQADHYTETWQLTSAPFTTRTRTWFGPSVPATPFAESVIDDAGFGQGFDWRTDEVLQTTDVPVYWRSDGVSQATRAELEDWLSNVHATSLGESEVDGHRVVGFEAFGHQRLFLDADTYLPVLSQSFGYGSGDEKLGYDEHYTWELLPATPANRQLLDLSAQHAAATVKSVGRDAWEQAEMELGKLLPALWVPGI